MKSLLIWLFATLIGGGVGFVISSLTGLNFYLCVVSGFIIGSSIGVTANIYRGNESIYSDSVVTDQSKEISDGSDENPDNSKDLT